MTDLPEYMLGGKALEACATNELAREYQVCASTPEGLHPGGKDHLRARSSAILAELATRTDWRPPYGGMCVP